MTSIVRTPVDAAADLRDFPWEVREVPVPFEGDTVRVRHVDEGPRNAPVVVFLHGNPSWMYIWRESIRATSAAGYRAIAIDLVGMGLSDRPASMDDYTVERHIGWTREALDAIGVRRCVLVLHDWGGIIGMRLAADDPDRFTGLCISNTGLPSRDPGLAFSEDADVPKGSFAGFQRFARTAPAWEPWTMLEGMMVTPVRDEVRRGYHAPYPDQSHTVGSRAFTQLLPTTETNPMLVPNWHAWMRLESYTHPVLTLYSDRDIVAPKGWKEIVARIPGAAGQPHRILAGGGHFLQEDIPADYNAALVAWLDSFHPPAHH